MANKVLIYIREFLVGRALSYRRVFDTESMDAQAVLQDLARFCRAHSSTVNANPHVAARLDGRREVWLRIQHQLKLSNDQIWELYQGTPQPRGDK